MNVNAPQSKTLLVAVDSSEPSQWALDEALDLAQRLGARVSLVHVVDVAPLLAPEYAADEAVYQAEAVQEGWEMVRTLARRVPDELFGKGLLRRGDAAREIVSVADELRPRLIVIGTHARGGLGRFLLGSVAEQVVRRANCPVLTVTHPVETPQPNEPVVASAGAADVCYSKE